MNVVMENILTRRSCRMFKSDKLEKEILKEIVKAGTFAPSAMNQQPWHFTVITNKEVLDFSRKVYNVFPEKPLQGIDIVFDNNKKLFALEGNQGGNVWTFSLQSSKMLAALGRTVLLKQFNAFDVACDILIKKTNELAK